jgi:hypothetical protein
MDPYWYTEEAANFSNITLKRHRLERSIISFYQYGTVVLNLER